MDLTVKRWPSDAVSTEGQMFIDGQPFGYTLENPVRDVKIMDHTAIPAGRYQVSIGMSPHFGRLMPRVLNVPNFTGVLIHMGNIPRDTEGCILVGWQRGTDMVGDSDAAFNQLYDQINDAINAGEQVWLTILDNAAD